MKNNIDLIIEIIMKEIPKISLSTDHYVLYKYNTIIKKLMSNIVLDNNEINIINHLIENSDLQEEEKRILQNYVIKKQFDDYNNVNNIHR